MQVEKDSVQEVGTFLFQSIAEEYHVISKKGDWKVTFNNYYTFIYSINFRLT